MSEIFEVKVPDIGGADDVDVVEVLVAAGDEVTKDQSLITLESDKASMEVPSPRAGKVKQLKVSAGDKASEGMVILTLEVESEGGDSEEEKGEKEPPKKKEPEKKPEPPKPAPKKESPEGDADVEAEVLVLGAGPGGYSAAFRAADLGRKVVLVERYPTLGGVCLNVGCIPSKALLHAAKVLEEAEYFTSHGIRLGKPKVDLPKLRGWKDSVVERLTSGVQVMARQRKVRVVQGTGRFVSPHRLEVETEDGRRTVAFETAIIAAGSRVTQLPFLPKDDPRVMDSTGALELEEVPKRLLIVGGGIIGLEMATVYHALGSKVTVVELMEHLIPGCDQDLVRPLHKHIAERYENIFLKTKVTRLEPGKKGLRVFFEGEQAPESDVFDRVLVAVGRRPNGKQIGAEAAGVWVDDSGFIPVDRQMRTNVAHIFAIGDVAGQPMLAHKASHEGKVAAEVAAGHKSAFDARAIPNVAYTDPEVAWAGLTETHAKAREIPYEKAIFPWAANGRSLALGRDEGRTKLLFDPETRRIVGAGIVGPGAGDLIAEIALAIEMGCEAADIGLTIHPHPTLSETVGMAAETFEGTVTDIFVRKKQR